MCSWDNCFIQTQTRTDILWLTFFLFVPAGFDEVSITPLTINNLEIHVRTVAQLPTGSSQLTLDVTIILCQLGGTSCVPQQTVLSGAVIDVSASPAGQWPSCNFNCAKTIHDQQLAHFFCIAKYLGSISRSSQLFFSKHNTFRNGVGWR